MSMIFVCLGIAKLECQISLGYDICMLRHSKSVMSMTFVCLGIAKLDCQISLGISLSNKPMYDRLKRKICKEKSKAKG